MLLNLVASVSPVLIFGLGFADVCFFFLNLILAVRWECHIVCEIEILHFLSDSSLVCLMIHSMTQGNYISL